MELMGFIQPADKSRLFRSFNPDNSLWIVSDIKSYSFVLERIRQNQKVPSDQNEELQTSSPTACWPKSVWRARDFWRYCLSLACPDMVMVPRFVLTFIYQEWARDREPVWQRGRETGQLLCQYMEAMAHVLQHPLKENLMEEWLSEEGGWDMVRWHKWAGEFWNHLNKGPKGERPFIVEDSWASAFLTDRFPYSHFPCQTMVFDLGFDMDPVEAELITQISQKIPVQVLVPLHQNKEEKDVPQNYKVFSHQKMTVLLTKKNQAKSPIIRVKKFATPLAELKDLSAYVGDLLQKGVPAQKIGVIAPEMEDYWLALKSHLKKEKVPVNKAEKMNLVSFYDTQLWFSRMWTHLSVIRYENMSVLSAFSNPHQNFSRLKSDLHHVRDIGGWPSELYQKQYLRDQNQMVSLSEFIKWALALLPELSGNKTELEPNQLDPLPPPSKRDPDDIRSAVKLDSLLKQKTSVPSLLKTSLNDFAKSLVRLPNFKLPYSSCLQLLESYFKTKEVILREETGEGIHCLSFNALSYLSADFVYIMGLSEQNLKTKISSVLPLAQVDSLSRNLGFFIKSAPVDKMEQIISHFMDQKQEELTLSFATSDFEGVSASPSFLWLKKAKAEGRDMQSFDIAQDGLWDGQKQKSSVKDILLSHPFSPARVDLMEQSIKVDQGRCLPAPFLGNQPDRITVSLLEDYVNCPFIFSAKCHFRLWDGPERDRDMPALDRGILIHKLFEDLTACLKKGEEPEKSAIMDIIEKHYRTNGSTSFVHTKGGLCFQTKKLHPLIWEKEKKHILQKALIFLKREKDNTTLLKDHKYMALEKAYDCYWNEKTNRFDKVGDIHFKGKIDRIDSYNQTYHIIDYKGQMATGSSAPSWEFQSNLQMAVYTQVVEQGLTGLPALPVSLALYLSYKDFSAQGLALKSSTDIPFLEELNKRSWVSKEQKQNILQGVNKIIQSIVLSMRKGAFSAQPKNRSLCEKCRWRRICRAPHLN